MPDSDRAGQGGSYFRAYLRSLPDDIALAREAGLPVVLDVDRPLPVHAHRLMDTLGVEVRVSTESLRGRGMGAYAEDGAARQPFVANLIDFRHSVVQAHKRADAGDESLEICAYCMCEVDVDPQPHRPGCAGIGGARATSTPVLARVDPLGPRSYTPPSPLPTALGSLARMDDGLPQEPEIESDVDDPESDDLEERGPEADAAPLDRASVAQPVSGEAASRSSSTNPYGLVKFGRGYIWTKPAALEAVRAFVAEHGRPPQNADAVAPTVGMFPSPKSVIQLFGSFDAMVIAAGLEPAPRRVRNSKDQVSRVEASALQPTRPPRERPVTAEDDTDAARGEEASDETLIAATGAETPAPPSASPNARLDAVRAAAHLLVDAIVEALA